MPSLLAPLSLLLPALLERLQGRFKTFLFLLGNDTTGVEERWTFAPILLVTWLLASLLTAPISHGVARFLGSNSELRKSTGTALGVAALQCGFFALTWLVVAWGNRQLDWSVFGLSLFCAAAISKWGHEIAYTKCMLHVALQSIAALLTCFLIAFGAAELGWTEF